MTSYPTNATLCGCGARRRIGESVRPTDCPKCHGEGWYVFDPRNVPNRAPDAAAFEAAENGR